MPSRSLCLLAALTMLAAPIAGAPVRRRHILAFDGECEREALSARVMSCHRLRLLCTH